MGFVSLNPTTAWQTLPLTANWVQYDTSNIYLPRYRKVGDIVFTTGLPRISPANNSTGYIVIATLPVGFRPNQLHSPVQYSSNGGVPTLFTPEGNIQIAGPLALDFAVWLNYSFSI